MSSLASRRRSASTSAHKVRPRSPSASSPRLSPPGEDAQDRRAREAMKPFLATRDALDAGVLDGAVLCHDLRTRNGALRYRKGRILRADDLPSVAELPWDELHLVQMEPGDLHEDEAGGRLGRAAAGGRGAG